MKAERKRLPHSLQHSVALRFQASVQQSRPGHGVEEGRLRPKQQANTAGDGQRAPYCDRISAAGLVTLDVTADPAKLGPRRGIILHRQLAKLETLCAGRRSRLRCNKRLGSRLCKEHIRGIPCIEGCTRCMCSLISFRAVLQTWLARVKPDDAGSASWRRRTSGHSDVQGAVP
ncbi:hypothetical protein TgHK011_003049 [Trichoderma gracile]|nr:hypothetical protein TgHK011_003049 [Trichoderma gracile]